MNAGRSVKLVIVPLGFVLVAGLGIAVGQQTAPTTEKGRTAKTVASLDLGPQIEGLQGRYLRMRVITYEPGGHGALHSHKDRPLVAYILHGTLTDCRAVGDCKELHEGQTRAEGKEATHWVENKSTKPVTFIAVEISKEP